MLITDFHTHTAFSPDSLTSPAELIRAARRKGVDKVVVTDHNSIAGARAAFDLDPQLILIGEEIMTTGGEILAAYVREEIPAGLSPHRTIQLLREQGAFISVSHPFDTLRKGGWNLKDLLEIAPLVDAVEVFNARCMFPAFNAQALAFAEQNHIPGTAGSDAHAAFEVGAAAALLENFEDADGLRQAIRSAKISAKRSSWWVHFFSRYASFRKRMNDR